MTMPGLDQTFPLLVNGYQGEFALVEVLTCWDLQRAF